MSEAVAARTRVLIVDDHPLFRAGLESLLGAWGFEVVGEAEDGAGALAAMEALQPELVFMDINMPEMSGLEATRAIKARWPDVHIVILTVSDDEQDLIEAVKSGAAGYLLKNVGQTELEDLISRLGRGEPVISPTLARRLLSEFAGIEEPDERGDAAELTAREHDVLTEVARGVTSREVGASLGITENTVNFHLKNIFSKLHVRNRSQIVLWAAQHGYLDGSSGESRRPSPTV
jgi:DNA-binding NarL/FixJ family response regulator